MIGWPAVKSIWRRDHKPARVPPNATSPDSRSNDATSGAPSEVGDEVFTIPKCKSAFVAKLQSSAGIHGPRFVDELARPIAIMKFDGRDAPPDAVKYANGHVQIELCDRRARLYDTHILSVRCFPPKCPGSGFQSRVGNETKLELLTHMKQRINASKVSLDPSVVDLTEMEIPPLSQPPPVAPLRKPSAGPTDSFGFSEIDRTMSRIGGEMSRPGRYYCTSFQTGL